LKIALFVFRQETILLRARSIIVQEIGVVVGVCAGANEDGKGAGGDCARSTAQPRRQAAKSRQQTILRATPPKEMSDEQQQEREGRPINRKDPGGHPVRAETIQVGREDLG
jgi:hypothetical protein